MRLGVDVSEHQAGAGGGGFDFAPFDFAVLRTTDGTYKDPAFGEHLAAARARHTQLAAYHFLRAPSEGTSVQEQVAAAVEVLGSARLPMWIDVESPAGLSLDDVRAAHRHFSQAGVDVAGIYTSARYWRRHMLAADPGQFGRLWLAAWGENPAVEVDAVAGAGTGDGARAARNSRVGEASVAKQLPGAEAWPHPIAMPSPAVWQFTSRGSVGGVTVDLNLAR